MVALIWGAAFIAQKDALDHLGSFSFVAVRFVISALLVLPFAWREHKNAQPEEKIRRAHFGDFFVLCLSFAAAVLLQQVGMENTSITNAGFLTGLYVIFTVIICRIAFGHKLSLYVFPAALMSVCGVYLLSGGALTAFKSGDGLVLLCAIAFGIQVAMVGKVMSAVKAPFRTCFLQYISCALVAFVGALLRDHTEMEDIMRAAIPILYAGGISGGIAYTMQVVAQQYTPASDSAVILSGESVFAAILAALMNGERPSQMAIAGCALIILAILTVEFGPYLSARRSKS